MQWMKGINSRVLLQEFPRLRTQCWCLLFSAGGYLAVSSGTITDEMIGEYIDEQEGDGSFSKSTWSTAERVSHGSDGGVATFGGG